EAKAAECAIRIDAAGNVHARPAAIGWDQKVWLSGSHIDSVPHGGTFDGVTGIIVPLEILRAAHEAQKTVPLELVIFAEEEGPPMWEMNIPVAIVTAINGRRQFACTIRGVANHAGSTPMDYRNDALVAAAECVVELEKLPRTLSLQTVCTVGRLNVSPNALNV